MRPGLEAGRNVDRVDIEAGLRMARRLGYTADSYFLTVEHALQRHARGEEDGVQRTALSWGIDLTSWYAILAAAVSAASAPRPDLVHPFTD